MKFIRRTSLWGALLFVCVSVIGPLGYSAVSGRPDLLLSPVFRFFQGGESAESPESMLERIFFDQLHPVNADPKADAAWTFAQGEGFERKLARHLYQLCLENHLDPAFVLSVIQTESRFRMDVVSSAGAVGLMQLMPETARVVAKRHGLGGRITPRSLRDPFLNLTLGVLYLRDLRERYSGLSPYYQLAAYNMGPARFDSLRSQPGFRPVKSLKYYQDVMKGIPTWRFYGPRRPVEEAAIQSTPPRVKTEPRSA